jgi:hypothetical protein
MNFKLIQQALVALEMYREYTPEGNGDHMADAMLKAREE